MTGEKLYEAIGMIDDRHLYNTILERTGSDAPVPVQANKAKTGRPVRRAIICLAAVIALLAASFTVAMAVSEEFRGQVRFTMDEELRTLRDGAVPAEEPEVCDGFNGLPWGSPVRTLSESAETEIVRVAGPVEGCYGTAYLTFSSDGGLYRGRYVFNESGTLEWAEIVTVLHALRNDLITRYGEPAEITSSGSTLSLEELSTAGSGTYMDMWDPVPTSEGNRVDISLALQPNGIIDLTYYCSGMPMPQQAPQQMAADEDYAQVEQMIADLSEVEITDPSQYESVQRSLSEWADDTDRYGVIPLCSSVGEYAATHEMTYSQVLSLLTVKKDFDGAVTEAYDWVLNQLYEYHPAQFVPAAICCIDQYGDTFIRDYTDFYLTNVKGTSLERESGVFKTIHSNLLSYGEFLKDLQSSDRPTGYSGIPSDARDMALRFFDSAMPESTVWMTTGASPAYAVDIFGPNDSVRLYFDREGTLIARSSTDARPYDRPETCDGFERVTWGTAIEDMPEGPETVIVRRGESFAGYYGNAYYTFNGDGRLVSGRYAFYEEGARTPEWREVLKTYLTFKNELSAMYGVNESKHDGTIPYSPNVIEKTGADHWDDVWNDVPLPDGRTMAIALRLWPDGLIELQYFGGVPASVSPQEEPPEDDGEPFERIEMPVSATAPSEIVRHALDTGEETVEVRYSPGPGMKTGVGPVGRGTFVSIEEDVRDLIDPGLLTDGTLPVYRIMKIGDSDGGEDGELLYKWLKQEAFDFLALTDSETDGLEGENRKPDTASGEPYYLLKEGKTSLLHSSVTGISFTTRLGGAWTDAEEDGIFSLISGDSYCRAAIEQLGITKPAVLSRTGHAPEEKSVIIYQATDDPLETMYNITFRSIRLTGQSDGGTVTAKFRKAAAIEYVGDGEIRPYEDAVSEAVSVYGIAVEDILAYDIGYYRDITPGYFIPCYRFIVNTHGQYFSQTPEAPEPEDLECIDIIVPAVALG